MGIVTGSFSFGFYSVQWKNYSDFGSDFDSNSDSV